MTNAELIAALRRCSYTTVAGADREDGYCKPCAYFAEDTSDITCIDRMMIDAADALEASAEQPTVDVVPVDFLKKFAEGKRGYYSDFVIEAVKAYKVGANDEAGGERRTDEQQ